MSARLLSLVKQNALGHSNMLVSEIGFRCMSLPADDDIGAGLLHRALAMGPVTTMDSTADPADTASIADGSSRPASKPTAPFLDVGQADVNAVQRELDQFTTATRTRAQVALRFALAHPAVATATPGASTDEQLYENLSASEPLDDDDIDALRRLTTPGRYDSYR